MMKLTSEGFIGDVKTFNFFYEFMAQNGLVKKYKHHLDIGGKEGNFGFLCQSINMVKDSLNVDLQEVEDNKLIRLYIYYKFLIRNIFSKYKSLHRFTGKNGYVNRVISIYNKLPLLTFRGSLRNSVKNVYELNEKFDLITSLYSLEFFDPEEILPKIYNLLEEQGICFINVNYYWYLKNIEGKLEFYGETDGIDIHKNCTPYNVENYCKLASKIGFEIISIRRNIQGNEITKRLSGLHSNINGLDFNPHQKNYLDMLEKAKNINKNILYEDLRTLNLTLILKKI